MIEDFTYDLVDFSVEYAIKINEERIIDISTDITDFIEIKVIQQLISIACATQTTIEFKARKLRYK